VSDLGRHPRPTGASLHNGGNTPPAAQIVIFSKPGDLSRTRPRSPHLPPAQHHLPASSSCLSLRNLDHEIRARTHAPGRRHPIWMVCNMIGHEPTAAPIGGSARSLVEDSATVSDQAVLSIVGDQRAHAWLRCNWVFVIVDASAYGTKANCAQLRDRHDKSSMPGRRQLSQCVSVGHRRSMALGEVVSDDWLLCYHVNIARELLGASVIRSSLRAGQAAAHRHRRSSASRVRSRLLRSPQPDPEAGTNN
jgi:hypothetical protein